jgi:hypothetical protein
VKKAKKTSNEKKKVVMMMTTKHQTEIDKALDKLDPATNPARDATSFRRIIAARKALAAADQELRDAVHAAREAGDSWTVIGVALDTSRQNAYQRFGKNE